MTVRSRSPTHHRLKRLAVLCLQAGPLKMNLQAVPPPKHGQTMLSGPLWQQKRAGQTQIMKRSLEENLQIHLPLSRGLAQDPLPALQPMMFARRKVGPTLLRMPKRGVRICQTLVGGNRPRHIGRSSHSMAQSAHGATIVTSQRTQATLIPATCLPPASDRATRQPQLRQTPPNGIRRPPAPPGSQILRSGRRCLPLLTTSSRLRINGRVCLPTPRPTAHRLRTRCLFRSRPR